MEKGARNNKKAVDVMLVKIREINNGTFIGALMLMFFHFVFVVVLSPIQLEVNPIRKPARCVGFGATVQ